MADSSDDEMCTKSSFKESFPLLYKAAEELDAAVGEGLLSENDLAILEKGPADGAAVLTAEAEAKKLEQAQRKKQVMTKVPEIRNRMRKTLETRHSAEVAAAASPKPAPPASKSQQKVVVEETKIVVSPAPVKTSQQQQQQQPNVVNNAKDPSPKDIDELVQLIEGTHIKNDPNPKKAAKKARQKERKEQERQRLAEERAREEAARKAEELRLQEEERKKFEMEKKRQEDEERRKKEEMLQKQLKAAEQKKEEQRRKREEQERRKAEEKKLKKEAKKQRREQRKREEDLAQTKVSDVTKTASSGKGSTEAVASFSPEKEYGRLKHEKEQRKREEEEARRLQELEAQERDKASKKSKKKKKKNKNSGDAENVNGASTEKNKTVAVTGQPLMEIFNQGATGGDAQGKSSEEKSNLVTIKKHMDSSVTISMKGKEGERDVVYTLVNGQVYPAGADGKVNGCDVLPVQQNAFPRAESSKSISVSNVTLTSGNLSNLGNASAAPIKNPSSYAASNFHQSTPMYAKEGVQSNVPEIDLSQLKLPPGITITKVPQHASQTKFETASNHYPHSNGMHSTPAAEFQVKPLLPTAADYHKPSAMGGFNSNVMVVDSRCSSLESQGFGGYRSSDIAYGGSRTRPSSETSIASDRPSSGSGMEPICHNGPGSYASRMGYSSNETFGKRVPMSMTSPFAALRNDTPSPAWQTDLNSGLSGLSGMLPQSTSITPDRHGFWSSSPASPVTFTPTAVSESFIRAQDQQFIKPKPHTRSCYSNPGKRSSPLFAPESGINYTGKIPPSSEFKPISSIASSTSSSFEQANMQTINHGSTPPSVIGPIGYKRMVESPASHRSEQWTPWSTNGERMSPEISGAASTFAHSSPFSVPSNVFSSSDITDLPWPDTRTIDRGNINRSVNPFGPIGSSRRQSNGLNSNGHQKTNEAHPSLSHSPAIEPSFWNRIIENARHANP